MPKLTTDQSEMNTPLSILNNAETERFVWVDFTADDVPIDMSLEEPDAVYSLGPPGSDFGLSDEQLREFEGRLPAPLPPDIRELLKSWTGFGVSYDVSFIDYNDWSYGYLLPHVMVLATDGCGNDWVIEVNPVSGEWKHVWFRCHDPWVLMYQCSTLGEFIEGVLDCSRFEKCQTGHRSILGFTDRAGLNNKRLPTAAKLRKSNLDTQLQSFVSQLPDNATVVDLRDPKIGDSFDTWEIPREQPLQRFKQELLFAYTKKPTFWQRLFRRF